MSRSIDPLRLRAVMGKGSWGVPERFGPDGWRMDTRPGRPDGEVGRVIVTDGPAALDHPDDDYRHASISFAERIPTYDELAALHLAVWGPDGWSCQVFVPRTEHVNFATHALHLWGRPDGARLLPTFGISGVMV